MLAMWMFFWDWAGAEAGRTTKNVRSFPLGVAVGMHLGISGGDDD